MVKKFLFSAIAFIGFTVASYGANTVEKVEVTETTSSLNILESVEGSTTVANTRKCRYHFYDANGDYLGTVTNDVPTNVPCGSDVAVYVAIRDFEMGNVD